MLYLYTSAICCRHFYCDINAENVDSRRRHLLTWYVINSECVILNISSSWSGEKYGAVIRHILWHQEGFDCAIVLVDQQGKACRVRARSLCMKLSMPHVSCHEQGKFVSIHLRVGPAPWSPLDGGLYDVRSKSGSLLLEGSSETTNQILRSRTSLLSSTCSPPHAQECITYSFRNA